MKLVDFLISLKKVALVNDKSGRIEFYLTVSTFSIAHKADNSDIVSKKLGMKRKEPHLPL